MQALVREQMHTKPKGAILCNQAKLFQVLTDPHTGKAQVIANQSRNVRSNIKRSVNSAVRAAYRSLAAFFIDLRPE